MKKNETKNCSNDLYMHSGVNTHKQQIYILKKGKESDYIRQKEEKMIYK